MDSFPSQKQPSEHTNPRPHLTNRSFVRSATHAYASMTRLRARRTPSAVKNAPKYRPPAVAVTAVTVAATAGAVVAAAAVASRPRAARLPPPRLAAAPIVG